MSSQKRQVLNSCELNGATTNIFVSESMDTKALLHMRFFLICFVLFCFFFSDSFQKLYVL